MTRRYYLKAIRRQNQLFIEGIKNWVRSRDKPALRTNKWQVRRLKSAIETPGRRYEGMKKNNQKATTNKTY
jgi:hypothetical protein